MRNKIPFLRKVRLFFLYRKSLRKIQTQMENNFNARIDNASRIYTVINIPSSLIEEPYNLRKEDIDNIAKNYIKEYSMKLSTFLNQNNLMELYDFYEVKKVEKYSYLVIFGFSLFNSQIFMRNFYLFTFFIFLFISIISLIILL
jgi:hypothetical protein